MTADSPQAILVVCLRYLGDTLLLRPPLRALRKAFPNARLDVLATAGTACALDDCANVSRVMEWPKSGLLGKAAILGKVAFARYDWVIDFTGSDRSALVALISGASLRAVYDRPKLSKWSLRRAAYTRLVPPKKVKPHAVIQRLELLEACGVLGQGTDVDLVPRREALDWANAAAAGLPAGWLHAHVTSRDMQKALPVPVVRTVLSSILSGGGGVVITSGPDDAERAHVARCVEGLPVERLRIFSDATWHQLVALISQSGRYWGSDTAPAHIAAALKKPMLVHYGPSKAGHWKPLHEGARIDERACACLKNKRVDCPRGSPGACLEGIDTGAVLSWAESGA